MIKFWTYAYELTPWTSLGALTDAKARPGSLLKCQWPNKKVGYADIFPWPELGDAPLDVHIKDLKNGKLSRLVEQAIWLAKRDAELRHQKKNAFAGTVKIKNHYLVNNLSTFTDEDMKQVRSLGYTTLKFKVGRSVDDEAKFLVRLLRQNPIMVRLDFNAKIDFQEFERFFSYFSQAEKSRIEFVEDPVKWDLVSWTEAAKIVPVALDNEYEKVNFESMTVKPPFSVIVIKPARQDVEKALKWVNRFGLKFKVSSSMDHAVGIAHASVLAAELKKFYPNTLLDCGCLSIRSYKPNEFTNLIQTTGPYIIDIPGTGVGFDSLLERLTWIPVNQ